MVLKQTRIGGHKQIENRRRSKLKSYTILMSLEKFKK